MNEYEYEEENLDEFMIKASKILISNDNNEEKEIIIESLKQHLSPIFNNQSEIQNFYKTLNMVIFSENSNKIKNRQCFKIFPIVFAFNPNSCFYYIDFYLFSLNQCIKEENRLDFSFLSIIFSEVITFLFSEKSNRYLLSKSYLLEENKKYKLYEKLFNFLREKIKSHDKISQSFGCLLLTELIEKCPIIKEEKCLEEVFKLLSQNLEDKKFLCKLDILNCLISLIFITEQKFKNYANICLFRVLDYLTDDQWIMRKLSINIVYTLVYFCKEQIIPVKNNIIEFLNILKDDPVNEIKEVCLQTLKLLEDENENNNKDDLKINGNDIINNSNNSENNKIVEKEEKKISDSFSENKESNMEEIINQIIDKDSNEKNKANKFINKNNNYNTTDKKKKIKTKVENNKKGRNGRNRSYKNIIKNGNKNKNPMTNLFINSKSQRNRTPNRNNIKNEIKDEIKDDNLLKTQIITERNQNDKSKLFNSLANADTQNNSNNKDKEKKIQNEKNTKEINQAHDNNKENKIITEKNKNENGNESNINLKEDKKTIDKEKRKEDQYEIILDNIMGQLGKIQEGQVQFLNMINDLKAKLDDNYQNLNERITVLEKNYLNDNNSTARTPQANHNSQKINIKRKVKTPKFSELKNKFRLGKYNEALSDAVNNEIILFKLLPLIDKNIIGKINNEILEDVINILNKKLVLINLENGRTILSDILSFYNMCIIKSKIPLKIISQLNIKDTLVMFKNKNSERLLQIDINNINAIVKSLKV